MAYELALVWSCLCGILVIYFLWALKVKKSTSRSKQKPTREVILEATSKRVSSVKHSEVKNALDSVDFMKQEPIVETKGAENGSSKLKGKQHEDSLHDHWNLVESNVKKGQSRIYHVKVKHERYSTTELDPDTLLPISRPLQSMDEVYQWMPGFDHFNIANVPLRSITRELSSKPKTILCHDMRGGYIEDRFVQGYNSTSCYRINDWNFIDIFIYFSHNIVTIPPPCWTNPCHRHGVKVLGTFITEWNEGGRICSELLETRESYQRFAKKLVEIACYYNFDGWLINIENAISPDKIEDLVHFIGFLTDSMHHAKPESKIIWYDSVTTEGELKWQNELNGKNSAFFDVCDGIFLNYTWSLHHLSRSAVIAGSQRKFDVYAGIDCFGRGCYGGGGWNTYKAMQVIREHNLSAAIFAPGWVLETQGEENFSKNHARFFQLLMPYLYPHIAKGLPLVSSFSQGYGNHYFSNGTNLMNIPWTNLSCQQFQPTFKDEYYKSGSKNGIEISDMFYCTDDAFEGGGCLKVNGKLNSLVHDSRIFLRLFRCECELPSEFLVSYTFKVNHTKLVEVCLLLLLNGHPNYILLSPIEIDEPLESKIDGNYHPVKVGGESIHPSREDPNKRYVPLGQQSNYISFHPLFGESKSHADQFCHNGDGQSNKWNTRYYLIAKNDLPSLKEIRFICMPKTSDENKVSQFSILLGEVRVMAIEDLLPRLPLITNIRCRDTTIKQSEAFCILNTTLIWDTTYGPCAKDTPVVHYDVLCTIAGTDGFVKQEFGVFWGKAFVESFRISSMKIANHRKSVEFYIRPVTECNIKAAKKDWATLVVEL